MDRRRQYGKQSNKHIYIRKSEKYESTKNQEKEDQIRCDISLFSFEEKDDSGCAHHMTGDKIKMESLMKNHHDNDSLGTDVSTKVLGLGTIRTNSGGIQSMKFQCSNFHT